MAIRAVVFDIGGVLERVADDAWPETWATRWEARAGLPAGAFAERLATHAPAGSVVTGEVTETQLRAAYAATFGLDEAATDAMMADLWDAYCGELDVEMYDFAAGLRPALSTAILSNSGDGARREEQRRYGFEQLVDTIVYSHEVGLAKPDPMVYALTTRRLGVRPDEVVFVDDVDGHVRAAREHGWHGVVHRETAATIREVTRIIDQG